MKPEFKQHKKPKAPPLLLFLLLLLLGAITYLNYYV